MNDEQSSLEQFQPGSDNESGDYRETSLGILPTEWDVRSLGDDFKIEYGTEKHEKDLQSKGYPVYGANGIIGYGDEYLFDNPVVAVTCRGATCGNVHLTEPKSWVTNNSLVLLDGNNINRQYLADVLRYHSVERAISGSAQPQITATMLSKMDYPKAPLSEQRKIATVLYTVDRAIEKTEKIIERVSRIKKGFKQDVFAEGYFDHQTHQESQIGRIPEPWTIESAADLCDGITVGVVTGATDSYVSSTEGVPFIRSQDVHENHIEQDSLKYISKEFHEQQNSSELREGDVITVRTGEPGTSCVIPPELDGANCFSLIISRPKQDVNEHFYSYYINSEKALDFIDSWKAGGVQDNFNVGVMERLPVPVPTAEEQQAIVDSLDDINKRLVSERQYRHHLQRLKQGLMQDLLSGEVRTTDTNIEVPEEIPQYG